LRRDPLARGWFATCCKAALGKIASPIDRAGPTESFIRNKSNSGAEPVFLRHQGREGRRLRGITVAACPPAAARRSALAAPVAGSQQENPDGSPWRTIFGEICVDGGDRRGFLTGRRSSSPLSRWRRVFGGDRDGHCPPRHFPPASYPWAPRGEGTGRPSATHVRIAGGGGCQVLRAGQAHEGQTLPARGLDGLPGASASAGAARPGTLRVLT